MIMVSEINVGDVVTVNLTIKRIVEDKDGVAYHVFSDNEFSLITVRENEILDVISK